MYSKASGENFNGSLTSKEWNKILLSGRYPIIFVTILLFILGLSGNILVFAVYRRYIHKNEGRFYIPYLALADAVAITITSLLMMISDINEAIFPSDALCRCLQVFNWAGVQNSKLFLFVIAIHRFKLVCFPSKKPLTLRRKRHLMTAMLVYSFAVSLPLFVLSGSSTVKVTYKGRNVTGDFCAFNTGKYPQSERAYEIVIFSANILMIIITVILYIPIGYRVLIITRNPRASSRDEDNSVHMGESNDSAIYTSESEGKTSSAVKSNSGVSNSKSVSHFLNTSIESEEDNSPKRKRKVQRRYKKGRGMRKLTITLMMVVVFYVISYIPFYVIVSLKLNDLDAWFNSPPYIVNGYLFIYRSYMLNNVVNPFIYSMFDALFREKLKKCLLSIKIKTSQGFN